MRIFTAIAGAVVGVFFRAVGRLFGFFGVSTERLLGRREIENKALSQELKDERHAAEIEDRAHRADDGELRRLYDDSLD